MGSKSKDAVALTTEEAQALYDHIRAVESLEADKADIQKDITERKTLCCETLPIQKDVLDFVIKRRKVGKGIAHNFDTMLQLVEEAVAEVEGRHAEETRGQIAEAARRGAAQHDGPEDDDEPEDDQGEGDETPDDPDSLDTPPFDTEEREPAF